MSALDALRADLPEAARDIKVNLQTVLGGGTLSAEQRWGVAVTAALTSRHPGLARAVINDARAEVGAAVVEDARAAATLMAMNNVYYRFRHHIEKTVYGEKPARLRMQRLAQPATSKANVELFSLAASAINGCQTCIKAHESVVLDAGVSEDQVHDAVRIAAVVHAAAVALDMPADADTTLEARAS
jgi:lipoyl-dependent peroxiredoxin subunit D